MRKVVEGSSPETEKLLSPPEAAQIFGITSKCLANWRLRGGGPQFVRLSATRVRYRQSDLNLWIEERIRASTSDTEGGV